MELFSHPMRRSLWPVVLVVVLALVLTVAFLLQQYRIQSDLLGEQQQIALDTAYRAILETTRRDIEARFRFQVHQPEVLDLIAEAMDAPAAQLPLLRGQLYRKLLPVYEELGAIGLLQFQFHLADDRVFLRFHLPYRADDPLFDLRPSTRIANIEQRSVHGLEIGRTASGFRYVFPLHREGRHLGSVELSMPFSQLQRQMNELLGGGEFALYFDREQVFRTIDDVNRVHYAESPLHPAFLIENPRLRPEVQHIEYSAAMQGVLHLLRENSKVQRLMPRHQPFSVSVSDGAQDYQVSFVPLADISGNSVAYVMHFKASDAARNLLSSVILQMLLATALVVLLGLLYIHIQRQRLQLREDIARREQVEAALQLYANIFEHSGEAILITDSDNRIMEVNAAFTELTGYQLREVAGKSPSMLASGHTPAATYKALWEHLEKANFWQGELWDRSKDGRVYPKWVSISALRDQQGNITHYIASFTDITDRKAAEAKIERLAHHDALTGLLNRYSLSMRLDQALLYARREQLRVAVLFIDMDRFKTINDSLGHQVGDQLLIEVANRLQGSVRESDIVARLGGDEFVVVLTNLKSLHELSSLAGKLFRSLGEPYSIANQRLHSSPSVGVALYPDDSDHAETLLKHADAAMYHAKNQGRNNVQYFKREMTEAATERLKIEQDLRTALVEESFELYYQPQVRASDRQIVGVEALVRWHHPEQGMMPPDKFIPIAEETGLIQALGTWILQEACRQLAAWRDAGLAPLRMAVNLSAHQLRSAGLVDQVAGLLAHHRLSAGSLELEITESVAMENPERAIGQLMALRDLGVELAIDDFGTGYSSLAYLKRLPIQTLKLDRSFVQDIETDANDAAISRATMALAHSLGLKVVAEGVETEGQAAILADVYHADLLQGYYFGRPQPAAQLLARLQQP